MDAALRQLWDRRQLAVSDFVLAADRTSCHTSSANQLRLFLHAGAYWMMRHLRVLMLRRSSWRVMQFDTLRLRLVGPALYARNAVIESKLRGDTDRKAVLTLAAAWAQFDAMVFGRGLPTPG